MSEFCEKKIGRKITALSMALTMSLGASACAKSEGAPLKGSENLEDGLENFKGRYSDFRVEHLYTESGKRITVYEDPSKDSRDVYITTNVAYCDGQDLVEMPMAGYGGNSVITRSIGHEACNDNVLTPSDFEANTEKR